MEGRIDNVEKEMGTMKGSIDKIMECMQELKDSVARLERKGVESVNQENRGLQWLVKDHQVG